MTKIVDWAFIGCGGMARRHLRGFASLAGSSHPNGRLLAVCDLDPEKAELLADEAETLLGVRPATHVDLTEMITAHPSITAAAVITDVPSHHRAAIAALELGLHVLSEKPLGITVRATRLMLQAAARSERLLGVAENFPRFPANRLARSLIADGAIGTPRLMREAAVRGRDEILQTPWRHQKLSGSLTFDTGVHNFALFQFFLGEVETIFAAMRLHEKVRRAPPPGSASRTSWWDMTAYPDEIEATGEDAIYAQIGFAGGAVAQWTFDAAGHGLPYFERQIFGSKGSLEIPRDRSGAPIRLHLSDGSVVDDERILDHAPSYRLDPLTAELFGGDRIWRHDLDFAQSDQSILAVQFHEFGSAILDGTRFGSDGSSGLRDVAFCYAAFEAGLRGELVRVADVLDGSIADYQREIDMHFGLTDGEGR